MKLVFRSGKHLQPAELDAIAADLRVGLEALNRVRFALNGRVNVGCLDKLMRPSALGAWTWLRYQLEDVWTEQNPDTPLSRSPLSKMPT